MFNFFFFSKVLQEVKKEDMDHQEIRKTGNLEFFFTYYRDAFSQNVML